MAYGVGASLASMGLDQKREAMQVLRSAADQESERNAANKQLAAQAKAGKQQLGSTIGAMGGMMIGAKMGSVGGPMGALIGGAVGAIAAGLFTVLWVVSLVVTLGFPNTAEAKMITQMELHQVLSYDPATGVFTWLDPAAHCVQVGDRAGFLKKGQNYRYIKLCGKSYAEHRLAWLYMTGGWPEFEIDHRNRDRADNRFENLRPVTHKQNAENRGARKGALSGFRGVSWGSGKWYASITHFGERHLLGYFDNIEDAKAARLKAEAELFTHSTRV